MQRISNIILSNEFMFFVIGLTVGIVLLLIDLQAAPWIFDFLKFATTEAGTFFTGVLALLAGSFVYITKKMELNATNLSEVEQAKKVVASYASELVFLGHEIDDRISTVEHELIEEFGIEPLDFPQIEVDLHNIKHLDSDLFFCLIHTKNAIFSFNKTLKMLQGRGKVLQKQRTKEFLLSQLGQLKDLVEHLIKDTNSEFMAQHPRRYQ